jgi:integrase
MPAISEKIVAALPAPASGNKLHYFSGAVLQGKRAPSGFAVRVTAAGTKSFVWFHRVNGRPYLETIGRWDENSKGGGLTVLRAIIAAKARADEVHAGSADVRPSRTRTIEDGRESVGETVADMLDKYTARYVEKDAKLRSADTIKRTLDRLVKPAIGKIGVYELRRSSVMDMLDEITDEHGPVMADRTLAYVRQACNWRAARDDKFTPPIVRGMARTKTKERARDRILSDDEIRALWSALDTIPYPGSFARLVRFLLLTACRCSEAGDMRWDEIDGDTWTIPAARYKSKHDHHIPLTAAMRKLIGERPADITAAPYVFSATGGVERFGGASRGQNKLRAKLGSPDWTLHDLRRTARSLMSRAKVSSDIAERCLGHAMPGVRGTYDRHSYHAEKLDAFKKLDALVTRIVRSSGKNVVEFRKARSQ